MSTSKDKSVEEEPGPATGTPDEAAEMAETAQSTQTEAAAAPEPSLEDELAAARTKAEENWDKYLRSQAELDNVRKRAARDVENARKYALEGIASELLPVRDSLELGLDAANQEQADLKSARDGMQLIQQMLAKLMEQYGIRPVEPAGEVFNPELHQAMSMQETADQPPNTVLAVMQKGYTLNDRLLRPAMVVVAKAPPAAADETQETGAEPENDGA